MGRKKRSGGGSVMEWGEVVGSFCDGEVFQVFDGLDCFSACRWVRVMEEDDEIGMHGVYKEVTRLMRWDFARSGRWRECPKLGRVYYYDFMGSELVELGDIGVLDEECGEGGGGDLV